VHAELLTEQFLLLELEAAVEVDIVLGQQVLAAAQTRLWKEPQIGAVAAPIGP